MERVITIAGHPVVELSKLQPGETLTVRTKHTVYIITADDVNVFNIEGNAKYCPTRRRARFSNPIVGPGFYMAFSTDEHPGKIVTSVAQEVELHIPGANEGPRTITLNGEGVSAR